MSEGLSRGRKIAGWVLAGLAGALLIVSAGAKFAGVAAVVESFEAWGLTDMRYVIATGELVSAVLFLVPVTTSAGVLLLSSYMGGAIMAHMSHGEPYLIPSVVLVVIWVAQYLREPSVLGSFRRRRD